MKIDVEFIPDTHVYLANGILCPSVSELIRFKFPEAYAGIPKKILKDAFSPNKITAQITEKTKVNGLFAIATES